MEETRGERNLLGPVLLKGRSHHAVRSFVFCQIDRPKKRKKGRQRKKEENEKGEPGCEGNTISE